MGRYAKYAVTVVFGTGYVIVKPLFQYLKCARSLLGCPPSHSPLDAASPDTAPVTAQHPLVYGRHTLPLVWVFEAERRTTREEAAAGKERSRRL